MKILLFIGALGMVASLTIGGVNFTFDYVIEAFQAINGGF